MALERPHLIGRPVPSRCGGIIEAKGVFEIAPVDRPSSIHALNDLMPPSSSQRSDQTAWRRPRGVSVGTWRYTHEGSIADHYDDFVANTPLCRVDLQRVAEVFPDTDGDSKKSEATQKDWVMDLGCGTGRASEQLDRAGYRVMAIDLSRPMLRQVANRELPNVLPLQANLAELDCIADDVAAGAICLFSTLGMIQGRQNRRQLLKHVRRIVRPGGKFLLHVHNRYAALTHAAGRRQLAVSRWRSIVQKDVDFGDAVYPYRGLPDMFLHQFSRTELLEDLTSCEWQIEDWARLSLDGSCMIGKRGIAGGFLVTVK